jgi:ectoine hydroxylase
VRTRDRIPRPDRRFTDVQRQLLGLLGPVDGDHAWGHDPDTVPLYRALREAGHLDRVVPALPA